MSSASSSGANRQRAIIRRRALERSRDGTPFVFNEEQYTVSLPPIDSFIDG